MLQQIKEAIETIRATKPVILSLTNYVTIDFMANGLLALGAAPIMSCCSSEIPELIHISHAVNINIGTLDNAFVKRCETALLCAKEQHIPLILDPVGAGASSLRTRTARKFSQYVDIIKGNASEILALYKAGTKTLGVEALHQTQDALQPAYHLAKTTHTTIVVSGYEDLITDGTQQNILTFGAPLMPLITGMGCTLTAIIAAFRSVIPDGFTAAKLATAYFGLCGHLAYLKTKHPGTFRSAFLDELYAANITAMRELV